MAQSRPALKPELPSALKGAVIPGHIAIIMDGNGRWARTKGRLRIFGHENGAESVREITRECARIGVKRLTLYAFSEENWKRPSTEVHLLMKLLKRYLIDERPEINENNIRFTAVGRIEKLPAEVRAELAETKRLSAANTGMVLSLALSYGARQELADAVRRIAEEAKAGRLDPSSVDEAAVAARLYDPSSGDVDLLIRTGGDVRISNFLLWQISYAEIVVTPKFWPEFRKADLHESILEFNRRERRFGGLGTT
jgi:undecaprenyl diphosphate synthase